MIIPFLRRRATCRMRSQTQQIAKNWLPVAGYSHVIPASSPIKNIGDKLKRESRNCEKPAMC